MKQQMSTSYLLVVLVTTFATIPSFDTVQSQSSLCGDWEAFKQGEKCFKLLNDNNFRTFTEAAQACGQSHNGPNTASLPVINSAEEQDFLVDYLFKANKHSDNFWIGARYSERERRFKWINDFELNYTNWDPRGPRSIADHCVEMQADSSVLGKWYDESCEKKNLVVCQMTPVVWSMRQLQQALMAERVARVEALEAANRKIAELTLKLDSVVPVGFLYTQLPNTSLPQSLWPGTAWTDVSLYYAGVFLRVLGSGSAVFGAVQEENVPRVTKVEYAHTPDSHPNPDQLPVNGWSDYVYTGSDMGKWYSLRFYTSGGEVRPRNMAVRVWKRTA